MDKRHDDFYQKFMEKRTQKVNNPGQSGIENCLPLPFEPHRAAPVTLPQKRVSNTSSDSGDNSRQVLSPAMPIIPDNPQPRLIPSTSGKQPPSGTLTPIQQFNKIAENIRPRSPNTIALSPIILIRSRCSELALGKAIKSNLSSFL